MLYESNDQQEMLERDVADLDPWHYWESKEAWEEDKKEREANGRAMMEKQLKQKGKPFSKDQQETIGLRMKGDTRGFYNK